MDLRKRYPKLKDVVTERQDSLSIGDDRENKLDIGDVRDVNYQNESPDGKQLKSSTLAIRNSENKLIGSICFNIDTSFFLQFEHFIKLFNQTQENPVLKKTEQFYYQSPTNTYQILLNSY